MVLRSWSKNRKAATTSRRSNVATLQRAAKTQHPDVATWLQSPLLRLGLGEGDFVHTLGPRRRFGAVYEDLGEDHEICGRKSETHHHLIIIVSSSSFLMFYPKFMMYQTFIML